LKTKLFTALLMLFFIQHVTAQTKKPALKVFVQTAKNDSVNNATLQVYLLPDSVLLSSQVFNKTGNSFLVKPFTKYLITVSCVGFETNSRIASITDKPVTTTVVLKRNTTSLQTVTIVSKKPLIKQEDDKTVVDATVLANSSTNAYEVLEKRLVQL